MATELPQDIYDALGEASERLQDASDVVSKNTKGSDEREENTLEKTKHPKQFLSSSERVRFRRIGEQLFQGALNKARLVEEAAEFQAKMYNTFQKVAHKSWDNALQAFLNMKLNVEKLYRELKGEDLGIFRSLWTAFKTAIKAFRIAMYAIKLAPLAIPVIKTAIGSFLSPFVKDLKDFYSTISETKTGEKLNSFVKSIGSFYNDSKNSLLGELANDILEWANKRVQTFINSTQMAVQNAMGFLKPALTILTDVIWVTLEATLIGGPEVAPIAAIVGFIIGIYDASSSIIEDYKKRKREADIVSNFDDEVRFLEENQKRLQERITELQQKATTENLGTAEREKILREIEEKMSVLHKRDEELFQLHLAKRLSKVALTGTNRITGESVADMLKSLGAVEGKNIQTQNGNVIIIRGVKVEHGANLMDAINEVEKFCKESLHKVLGSTDLKDMSTEEFLKNYELYSKGDIKDLSQDFLKFMDVVAKNGGDKANEMLKNSAAILIELQKEKEEAEAGRWRITEKQKEIIETQKRLMMVVEKNTKLQTLISNLQPPTINNENFADMPQWVSEIMKTMGKLMKTFDSPIFQTLMETLSKAINEALESFNFTKNEKKTPTMKRVGTHGDENTMLNIIRTEQLEIKERLSTDETQLHKNVEKLNGDLKTLTGQLLSDEVNPRNRSHKHEIFSTPTSPLDALTRNKQHDNETPHTSTAHEREYTSRGTTAETQLANNPTTRLGSLTVEDCYVVQKSKKETVVLNMESTMNALTWCIHGTALSVNNDEPDVIIIS